MTLAGKGYYIWKIRNAEGGDAAQIANQAVQAGFSHVLLKVADGAGSYNVDLQTGDDLVGPVVTALRSRGIQVWGWHYVYGFDPLAEADKAIQRAKQFNVDGYTINAEAEYKQPGRAEAARKFMDRLRKGLPNTPLALSSYRYPTFHPQLPWKVFLEKCDYNMPQVYWMQSHNPGEQLIRSVREFQALAPFRPIIPTGSAFTERGWTPTGAEVTEFMKTAQSLNLSGVNFWEWGHTRQHLPELWDIIKAFPYTIQPPSTDIAHKLIQALNSQNVNEVLKLYNPNAVHVMAARTISGEAALRAWYTQLFKEVLPGGKYTLSSYSGTGSSRYLSWTATSSKGAVRNGSDTLGLLNGKISYHYSYFRVS